MGELVVDASALVDLLLANELGQAVGRRVAGHHLHAPAHVDAEVLSALGRLHRAGDLDPDDVETKLALLTSAPITRHAINDLLLGAWARRHRLALDSRTSHSNARPNVVFPSLATVAGRHRRRQRTG